MDSDELIVQARHVGKELPHLQPGGNSSHQVAGKREVDLYVRTYMTLLQSSGAISVSSLEPAHFNAVPSLHAGAREREPDLNALLYSAQRLPASVIDVQNIVLGQSTESIGRAGYRDLVTWSTESAPGRRRKWLYNGKETLAAQIASSSDLDDLIPTIVAYQIECTKIHAILLDDDALVAAIAAQAALPAGETGDPAVIAEIGEGLLLSEKDWLRLQQVWHDRLWRNLVFLSQKRPRFTIRMLGASYVGYDRATRQWWQPVSDLLRDLNLQERPVYFVSSNTHSLVNVLAGTARRRREQLTAFVRETSHPELLPELEMLESGESRSSWDNLLYFTARHYFADKSRVAERRQRAVEERQQGIYHIEASSAVDVGVQVIDMQRLNPANFDSRLLATTETIDPSQQQGIIININYPLGLSAYHIMRQLTMSTDQLRGIYILGKAATLNGRIGDVMLANVVYDEHSGNTYWLDNCFTYERLAPYLVYGAALDNQKAVAVKGTYLQNEGYLDFYYRENYTVVEMEAGPYLNAIFEDLALTRYPYGEAINLAQHSSDRFDLGIIHYASDTPYTRAQTLGAQGLSYYGMDSTYASTLAILDRIFEQSGMITAGPGVETSGTK